MRRLLPIALLALCLAATAWAAGVPHNPFRSAKPVTRPAPRPVPRPLPKQASIVPVQPIMSIDGLERLREVYVQPHVAGEAKFLTAVGTDQKKLKADVEARLRRIPGLKVTQNQSPLVARLLVQIVGHSVPGYSDADPPAAAHLTLAVMQPVLLARRGPAGQPIQSNGLTYHATIFSTNKTSNMRALVKEKVGQLLDGFEKDYLRANPSPKATKK